MINYGRRILELDDDELENFVLSWVNRKKKQYYRVEKFSGPGDLGRDVVGFVTKALHEGDWDNYQCKQYRAKLGTDKALLELGKVLYHSFKHEYTVPRSELFVAPRGINRNLTRLFNKPSELRDALLINWSQYCEKDIVEGEAAPLTPELRAHIEAFDFAAARHVSLHELLVDPDIKPVLFEWFGEDPGPPPKGIVPRNVVTSELPYINKLVDAYSERNASPFGNHTEVETHAEYGPHMNLQRERFYDADAFLRFYRDNTSTSTIAEFSNDIFHGVIDVTKSDHKDSLTRVDAVMAQAANIQPSGILAKYARVPVKQGVCHHLANDDKLKWKK